LKQASVSETMILAWALAGLFGTGCAGTDRRDEPGRTRPAAVEAQPARRSPAPAADPVRRLLIAYQSNLGGELEACG
jgi:hypothetical protein